jgi:peptide/nickel transport system substrate-binding protein
MKTTRRDILKAGVAATAFAGVAPTVRTARAQATNPREAHYVPHGDLRVLDPFWTTANMTAYHGMMVFDTLYGIDSDLSPKPQMVGQMNLSDDRKTYTFKLRPGLKFHDGSAVNSDDCVASIRRWAARDGAGQHMMQRVTDISRVDDDSFKIVLREPYGLLLDALAKTSTPLLYVMKKADGEKDPNTQIDFSRGVNGTGPFKFLPDQYRPGSRVVYERNADYVPRSEPASGIAGGKRVHLERVVWNIIPDPQTAAQALLAGEIDFFEVPPLDLIDTLQGAPGVKVEVLNTLGNVGYMRLNHLHPPFNNVKARQAALLGLDQNDTMRAAVGDQRYWRVCGAHFTCGSPMDVPDGSEFLQMPMAQRRERARQLLRESGYDGRPVICLHATDIHVMNQSALVIAQSMRQIGMNVQLAASDWGGVVTRRAVKSPPEQGGWNIFFTWGGGNSTASPISLFAHAATGQNAWFGWPENALHEQLRNEWAAAPTLEARRAVIRRMQANMYDYVHDIKTGQWTSPVAYRDRLSGILPVPEVVPPWWNVQKRA